MPPWLAKEHPDITDWNNLNKYADMFKTSESGDKGQLLDGDPSFVTNDEALVKNLNLNYKVVYGGSETALIQAFRQAEQNKTPVIGYFYSPQWLFAEIELVKVKLPKYTAGCDADAEKIACDYPDYDLDKIVSKKFADSDGPAYQLVKNFKWTNDDQNVVAKYIAEDKLRRRRPPRSGWTPTATRSRPGCPRRSQSIRVVGVWFLDERNHTPHDCPRHHAACCPAGTSGSWRCVIRCHHDRGLPPLR